MAYRIATIIPSTCDLLICFYHSPDYTLSLKAQRTEVVALKAKMVQLMDAFQVTMGCGF